MKQSSLLALLLMSSGGANAADRIRYEEIPARLVPFGTTIKAYGVKVTTVDGRVYKGQSLWIKPTQLEVGRGDCAAEEAIRGCVTETVPGEKVTRIEIRRGRRAFDFTIDTSIFSALLLLSFPDGSILAPGFLAFAAGSAPVTLAIDGVELLIPPKVYEIVH